MTGGIWERHKPAEYYSASDFEKVQWVCGIPSKYWNVNRKSIKTSSFTFSNKNDINKISSTVQNQYYKERLDNPELLLKDRFACFTSFPTDEYAMAAACLLATQFIADAWRSDRTIKVRVDDIQDYEKCIKINKEFYNTAPDVLVIYNLNDNTSRERLSTVVDVLRQFEGRYRAVVAASENPLEFTRKRLQYEPQEVYHFEGKMRKVVSR